VFINNHSARVLLNIQSPYRFDHCLRLVLYKYLISVHDA
jgi:hypothetical protein